MEGLRHLLQVNDYTVIVDYAMRYGTPDIPAMLNQLKLAGAERVLLMPMYPQYSSSTTATAFDAAFGALKRMRNQLEIRTLRHYADHPRTSPHWRRRCITIGTCAVVGFRCRGQARAEFSWRA